MIIGILYIDDDSDQTAKFVVVAEGPSSLHAKLQAEGWKAFDGLWWWGGSEDEPESGIACYLETMPVGWQP